MVYVIIKGRLRSCKQHWSEGADLPVNMWTPENRLAQKPRENTRRAARSYKTPASPDGRHPFSLIASADE